MSALDITFKPTNSDFAIFTTDVEADEIYYKGSIQILQENAENVHFCINNTATEGWTFIDISPAEAHQLGKLLLNTMLST